MDYIRTDGMGLRMGKGISPCFFAFQEVDLDWPSLYFLEKILTTPSMAMYSNHLGLTMLKIRSMYSKIASIITSSSLGAGLREQRRKDKIFIATTKLAAKERVA